MLIPVMYFSNSPDICAMLPTPPEPNSIWPGLDLAKAISSITEFTGNEGLTSNIIEVNPTSDTGAKSFNVSYGSFAMRPGLVTWVENAIISVYPSGGALLTNSAAMTPLAPGRLSTSTGCPRLPPTFGAMPRVKTSSGPPGGAPTRIRMGFDGKLWAWAAPESSCAANPAMT